MSQLLDFLNGQMNQPLMYDSFSESWFHYLSLILVIIGSVLAVTRMKGMNEKKLNLVLILFSVTLLSFEIYKQIIFTYQASGSYQWYAFPFQFCSTPMYVSLVAGLVKNKRIKQALINFLATFGLFAGLAVMLYPATVFVSTIGINIQTMVHHGGMMVLGVGLLAHHVELKWKSVLSGSYVFAFLMLVAMALNGLFNHLIHQGTFNMFFINHLFENGIPVLMIFQPLVPHVIFLLIYLFGFTLLAALVFGIRYGIDQIALRREILQKVSN